MKQIYLFLLLVITILLLSCGLEETKTDIDKTLPVIRLQGNKSDTAYLDTYYQEQGASVIDGINGCMNPKVTGKVNIFLIGTYYLDYDYTDSAGNKATTVTRTVQVVKNTSAFLNGIYNVACTCTAILAGSPNHTITTTNYTAAVTPNPRKNYFELSTLNIGSEYVIPFPLSLSGNSINVSFYSRGWRPGGDASSGTLSPTKNTFTIESTAYQFSPDMRYLCRNIYTKSLILN